MMSGAIISNLPKRPPTISTTNQQHPQPTYPFLLLPHVALHIEFILHVVAKIINMIAGLG